MYTWLCINSRGNLKLIHLKSVSEPTCNGLRHEVWKRNVHTTRQWQGKLFYRFSRRKRLKKRYVKTSSISFLQLDARNFLVNLNGSYRKSRQTAIYVVELKKETGSWMRRFFFVLSKNRQISTPVSKTRDAKMLDPLTEESTHSTTSAWILCRFYFDINFISLRRRKLWRRAPEKRRLSTSLLKKANSHVVLYREVRADSTLSKKLSPERVKSG